MNLKIFTDDDFRENYMKSFEQEDLELDKILEKIK